MPTSDFASVAGYSLKDIDNITKLRKRDKKDLERG
jgi:hypothetical protein